MWSRSSLAAALALLTLSLRSCDGVLKAERGAQLQGLDDDADAPKLNMGFMRVLSKDCVGCMKECVGLKMRKAQANSAKMQAPISLITWYLFRNRPFKMWPLEDAIGQLAKVALP